jgi:hypothetical protein
MDGSALHGLYPGLEIASIGAFQFGRDGVTKCIKMRLPKEMRQLSGTAEFLAVGIAARHSREGERLHIVTDCLIAVQSWQSSVWRRDDYRKLAGGFWRLMGERAPHLVSKVRAHLSPRQARKVGLCEEWRRGNEVVDNIAISPAERAYEDKELIDFKKCFDADVELVKATLARLERTTEYNDGTRKLWKEHSAKPKALRGRARRGNCHVPVWHAARGSCVCSECGSFSRSATGFRNRSEQVCVRRRGFWKESHSIQSLIRIQDSDTRIPVLLCKRCFCYSSSRAMGFTKRCTERSRYPKAVQDAWTEGMHPATSCQLSLP